MSTQSSTKNILFIIALFWPCSIYSQTIDISSWSVDSASNVSILSSSNKSTISTDLTLSFKRNEEDEFIFGSFAKIKINILNMKSHYLPKGKYKISSKRLSSFIELHVDGGDCFTTFGTINIDVLPGDDYPPHLSISIESKCKIGHREFDIVGKVNFQPSILCVTEEETFRWSCREDSVIKAFELVPKTCIESLIY